MKCCTKCKVEKQLTDFHKRGNGTNTMCKACINGSYKRNMTESNLHKNFRMNLIQFNALMELQNSRCKICNIHRSEVKRNFNVDHCHITGRIRGLLCNKCNMGLGLFQDDPSRLRLALSYVESVNKDVDKIVKS